MNQVVFLPGAGGRRQFWAPVAERLCLTDEPLLLGWPGFGDTPPDPRVRSLTDLVDYVLDRIEAPADLVAQSMGGGVALLLVLRRPTAVRRLVLCGTSGGIDMRRFEADDWRSGHALPEEAPRWFVDDCTDLTDRLPQVTTQTLLLWGEADSVSPPAVGRCLAGVLPCAQLVTIAAAGHMLAEERPQEVAAQIQAFLEGP